MSLLRRRQTSPYRRPRFPRGAEWVVLVDETGAEDGPYRVDGFREREDEPGVWVNQTEAGHARFLRVVEQKGDRIVSLDGEGAPWRYRIVAVPADEVSGG
jgi:hypothetical protein